MTTTVNGSAESSAVRDSADDRSWALIFAVAAPIFLGAVLVPFAPSSAGATPPWRS